jgi:hypothetical protein
LPFKCQPSQKPNIKKYVWISREFGGITVDKNYSLKLQQNHSITMICQTYQHFKHTHLHKTRVSKHTIVTDKDTQPITNLKFSRHSNNKISKQHRNIIAFCTSRLNNSYFHHKNDQALRKLNVAAPYHSNHCQYRVKKMF